jgi:hypothetical protein
MANYSACADIAADLISALCTGTNLDIAATDQIRPIATTAVIAIIHARILFPFASRELGAIGLAYLWPSQREAVHRFAKFVQQRQKLISAV